MSLNVRLSVNVKGGTFLLSGHHDKMASHLESSLPREDWSVVNKNQTNGKQNFGVAGICRKMWSLKKIFLPPRQHWGKLLFSICLFLSLSVKWKQSFKTFSSLQNKYISENPYVKNKAIKNYLTVRIWPHSTLKQLFSYFAPRYAWESGSDQPTCWVTWHFYK